MDEVTKISRRVVLRSAATVAAAVPVLIAGISAAEAKSSQAAVKYQDSPKGAQSCSNCKLFIAPNACKNVEGTISPNGWCNIYLKA